MKLKEGAVKERVDDQRATVWFPLLFAMVMDGLDVLKPSTDYCLMLPSYNFCSR